MGSKAIAIVGVLALAGLTVPASAADLGARPITKAPIAAPIAVYDWSGFYIGGHIGGAWADKDWSVNPATVFAPFGVFLPGAAIPVGSHRADGFLAGGQIGFNWQTGAWVFGVEGDASWTNADGQDACFGIGAGLTCRTEMNWMATITGRVGYAWNNVLLYAKGGVAFVDEDHSVFLTGLPGLGAFTAGVTRTGWTVGAGLEYGFTPNWSAKIEYNFMDFGNDTVGFTFPGVGGPLLNLDIDQQVHVVKAGINYRFNWGTPVAGRY
jgi:outer membrane immunogenic protein